VPDDEAARHPLLQRLDAFIGEWSIEASLGPDVTGRAVFEWVLGGQFLIERSEAPDVPDAPDGIAIIGVDREGEAYTQHYFDSRGVARVYAMTFRDGVWTLLRDAPDFRPLRGRAGLVATAARLPTDVLPQRHRGRVGTRGSPVPLHRAGPEHAGPPCTPSSSTTSTPSSTRSPTGDWSPPGA
jgi:hypothetical protein